MAYQSGFGLPANILFDTERARRLFSKKWFFAGTRGDVPRPRDYFTFEIFNDDLMLVHGSDGKIRCFVNRCAHQSAKILKSNAGTSSASLVCPNHQWSYSIDSGALRGAAIMGADFIKSDLGSCSALHSLPVREVAGLLFVCLGEQADDSDMTEIESILGPYIDDFCLAKGGYKLAHHYREIVPANWLQVMVNNRECFHCQLNHKGLLNLFDPSSFNAMSSPGYEALFTAAVQRWESLDLPWKEQAFNLNDSCRVARYPLKDGFKSITFDGQYASKKLIGGWQDYDASTLSIWLNPNAWVHFVSDHIATNWVLPIDEKTSMMYSSWIVHEDAVEGEDYDLDHLTEVWRVTNAEDVHLCNSMTRGAMSSYYKPGPFADAEQFCKQFCDWYMKYSG
jgi:Rieske 2Fe-2S family protein